MAKAEAAKRELYSAYCPERIDVCAEIGGPSLTAQEFVDECDLNKIMERYDKGIEIDPRMKRLDPLYVDFTAMPSDLQSAMNMVMDADEAFMRLPALVRKEFDNDPLRFVEYAQDGSNLEQLRKWGLAEPEKAPEPPMRVEVVNPPSGGSEPPKAAPKASE
uniref:Minor capsid protein n=1 Tax=Gokushovirinae environmental samples TaxID=1478972 RepID=A0A2R3UAC4_9VIRU|nr:minor capsid protein [Gokushovirinae environmental samples]